MYREIVARLIALIPTVLGAGTLVFFATRLIPGDAVDAMFSTETVETLDPVALEAMRRLFGLDRPLHEQYVAWLLTVVRGDLGISIRTQTPVLEEIMSRFPATVHLALGSLLISVAIAIPLAVLSTRRRNSWLDLGARTASLVSLSVPNFWLGVLLIWLFAVVLRVLPAAGHVPLLEDPLESLRFSLLPMVALGTALAAITMRQTRSQLLEVLSHDYVRTARAKGLDERKVMYRHALRNALIPVVTVVGLQLGTLLGGTIIIEQVFSWPGVGQLLLRAINQRDYPVIQGTVLFLALFFMLANLIVDLLYAYLDPRLRRAESGSGAR